MHGTEAVHDESYANVDQRFQKKRSKSIRDRVLKAIYQIRENCVRIAFLHPSCRKSYANNGDRRNDQHDSLPHSILAKYHRQANSESDRGCKGIGKQQREI